MRVRSSIVCAAAATLLMCSGSFAERIGVKTDAFSSNPGGGGSGITPAAFLITFDDGAVSPGQTLSNQYQGSHGVTFVPSSTGASGVPNPPNGELEATNPDMTISTVATESGSGVGAPLSGNVLHSFSGWLNEDGNPMMTLIFSTPIDSIGADFGGNSFSDSALCAVDGSNTVIATAFMGAGANDHAQLNLGTPVSKVVIVMGAYDDYVAVDNISFTTAVPEPASLGFLGLGLVGVIQRRRRA